MKTLEEIKAKLAELNSQVDVKAKTLDEQGLFLASFRNVIYAASLEPKYFNDRDYLISKLELTYKETAKAAFYLSVAKKYLKKSYIFKNKYNEGLRFHCAGIIASLIWLMGDEDKFKNLFHPNSPYSLQMEDFEQIESFYNLPEFDDVDLAGYIFNSLICLISFDVRFNLYKFSPKSEPK